MENTTNFGETFNSYNHMTKQELILELISLKHLQHKTLHTSTLQIMELKKQNNSLSKKLEELKKVIEQQNPSINTLNSIHRKMQHFQPVKAYNVNDSKG